MSKHEHWSGCANGADCEFATIIDTAELADLRARLATLTAELAQARDEVDAVGSIAKEAADWVRRLAEFAPLLHANDHKEGEAEARAWLAAWDSAGPAIVAKRASEAAAACADLSEAEMLLERAPVKHEDRSPWVLEVRAWLLSRRKAPPAPITTRASPSPTSRQSTSTIYSQTPERKPS